MCKQIKAQQLQNSLWVDSWVEQEPSSKPQPGEYCLLLVVLDSSTENSASKIHLIFKKIYSRFFFLQNYFSPIIVSGVQNWETSCHIHIQAPTSPKQTKICTSISKYELELMKGLIKKVMPLVHFAYLLSKLTLAL